MEPKKKIKGYLSCLDFFVPLQLFIPLNTEIAFKTVFCSVIPKEITDNYCICGCLKAKKQTFDFITWRFPYRFCNGLVSPL